MKKKAGNRLTIYMVMLLVMLQISPLRCKAAEPVENQEDACRGVVRVLAVHGDGSVGSGSGFGVGAVGEPTDIYVTNWHVVTNDAGKQAQKVYILLSNDAAVRNGSGELVLDRSKMVECEVLYLTTGYPDVAVLKASEPITDHVALRLMYAEDASRGDDVFTLGFPATADYANGGKYLYAEIKDVDMAKGGLSKFMEFEIGGSTMSIQHDAHINHGNSGGPLVTKDGNVIGINTYGYGEESMEYSVSIYVDYAMVALDELGISYDVYDPHTGTTENTGTDAGSDTGGGSGTGTDTEGNGEGEKESVPVIGQNGEGRFPVIPAAAAVVAAVAAVAAAAVLLSKRKKNGRVGQPSGNQEATNFTGSGTQPAAPQEAVSQAPISPLPQAPAVPASQATVSPPPAHPASPGGKTADSGIRLQGTGGAFSGRRFPVNGTIRIGRDPARNDLVYPAGTKGISGVHCEIRFHEGKVFVRDVGSTYGTFLRGMKIPVNQMVPVNIGESVCLGNPQESFLITSSAKRNE